MIARTLAAEPDVTEVVLADVDEGRVQEVVVGAERIRGTLKAPDGAGRRSFTAIRIEDPKLVEELEARGVRYTGEVSNRWLPELLGWVIPLLLVVAVVASCSTVQKRDVVRAKAAQDLRCPEGSINVTHVGRDSYEAKGCEGMVTYTCASEGDTTTCFRPDGH